MGKTRRSRAGVNLEPGQAVRADGQAPLQCRGVEEGISLISEQLLQLVSTCNHAPISSLRSLQSAASSGFYRYLVHLRVKVTRNMAVMNRPINDSMLPRLRIHESGCPTHPP